MITIASIADIINVQGIHRIDMDEVLCSIRFGYSSRMNAIAQNDWSSVLNKFLNNDPFIDQVLGYYPTIDNRSVKAVIAYHMSRGRSNATMSYLNPNIVVKNEVCVQCPLHKRCMDIVKDFSNNL